MACAVIDVSCAILKGLKEMRFRRRSLKTTLGITKAKKRINRAVGITAVKKPFRAPGNAKRRVLRRVGYYSGPMKVGRWLGRLFGK